MENIIHKKSDITYLRNYFTQQISNTAQINNFQNQPLSGLTHIIPTPKKLMILLLQVV